MTTKLKSETAIEAVIKYRKKGWRPFPLPVGQKKPDPNLGWQKAEATVNDENIEQLWSKGENIGVILDSPLVDIDLDCDETIAVAPHFLPSTPFKFGRNNLNGLSHYVYECLEAEVATYVDPVAQEKNRNGADLKAMLIEIRTGEMYTMFPPSVHPSGAQLKFGLKGGFPEAVLFKDLKSKVDIIAAIAIMVRYWPTTGGRNEATMALCGGLVRHELNETIHPDLVEKIVKVVIEEGGNTDAVSDFNVLHRTRKTFKKIEAGAKKKVKGWTSLEKLLGSDGKTVVKCFRDWLGILPKRRKGPSSPLLETSWVKELIIEIGNKGEHLVARTAGNISTILKNDIHFHYGDDENESIEVHDELERTIYYDEFRRCKMIASPLPWDSNRNRKYDYPRPWEDVDIIDLQGYIAKQWGVIFSDHAVVNGVESYAAEVYKHEIKDYLQGVVWDKEPRIEQMGQRYFNGEENVYTRAVWKMWMIAAVARVFNSGCQADNAIILEGKQGLGKSTALRILTSKDDWFTDSTIDMTSKAGAEVLSGAWIVEIGELSSMKRVDVNTTKEFISRRFDKYRPAYARETVTIPRMCVFAGTVNPGYDGYLKDDTGNRRFWPVPCGASINLKLLEQERDQLWAEAVDLYNRGERWWVSNEENELLHHFEIKQRSRRERGQLEDKLTIWLIEKLQQNKNEEVEFTIAEALEKAFEIPVKEHSTKYWVKNLGETCSRMGIERSQIVRARYYYTTQDHNGAEQKKCTMSSQYIITYDQMHELTDGDIDLKLDLDRMNSIENNQLNETLEEEDDGIPF